MPLFASHKQNMISPEHALPGRQGPMPHPDRHAALETPWPSQDHIHNAQQAGQVAYVAMGCFWGAERLFWQQDGVLHTAVGYMAGFTPHPTYDEVCSGLTGHTEAVQILFDPDRLDYSSLLRLFWTHHNPTQGMRQGNDLGTQYRSGLYVVNDLQNQAALQSRQTCQSRLNQRGFGPVTTEILPAGPFYLAEPYHQQYLHKVPHGYCGLAGTGISW